MADPFDDGFFDANQQDDTPRKPGLVIGTQLTPEEFAAKFVGKTGTEGMKPVTFEVENADGSITQIGADDPTPMPSKRW